MVVLIALVCAAAQSTVFVAEGEHSSALLEALSKEPDLVVGTEETADVSISLVATSSAALTLVVREREGSTALERTIDLARGLDPALRMAVLLIRGAVELPPTPPAAAPAAIAPSSPVADESPATLGIEVTPALATTDVTSFDPAAALYVHVRYGDFAFGLAGTYGAGVLGRRDTGTIEGEIRDRQILVDVAWSFLRVDRVSIAAFVSGGYGDQRFTVGAQMPPFSSPGTKTEVRRDVGVILGGLGVNVAIAGRFAVHFRAGARVLPQRIEVGLPQDFVDAEQIDEPVTPLNSSLITGFLSLGTTIEVF